MAKRLKVGVIGLGTVAQIIHLPILKNLSDLYEIAALCDISRQLLEDIGKRYSIDRLYTTPHELVAQQDIDVVFVLFFFSRQPEVMVTMLALLETSMS